MENIWLKHYPPGMPAEVNMHQYGSLSDVLRMSCDRFADLIAYSNTGASISYAELDQISREFAAFLQGPLGLRPGDRVALMMPNLLQYPVALFAILRAGLAVVNVNPQSTAPELEYVLKDSGAAAIVVLENFAHTLQKVLDQNRTLELSVITTEVGDLFPPVKEVVTNMVLKYVRKMVPPWEIEGSVKFNAALRTGRDQLLRHVVLSHDDIAFLQYTGGTTGTPKGAVLTHGNLVANLQQVNAWIARDLTEGEETLVCPLPLHHIYALTCCLVFMKLGAHTVLITNPRDMHAVIHDLKKYRFTALVGVNTWYRALLESPEFPEVNTRGLKVASAGGMAVQRAVAERWKKATGVPLIEGYGLTEAAPVVTSNPLNSLEWTGSIGLPLPSTQVAILDERGHELPAGEVGEICVRGPQVMPRYWSRPDETAKVITPEGWLRTGDLGVYDERGYFTLTDRKKDVIIVSGFKVFPNQVEDVVALHPGVAEVVALGAPDAKSGEAVKIIVVKRDLALTEQALLLHCREHLIDYKIPKIVEFRTQALPKNALGKILRHQLRQTQASAQSPLMASASGF